ARSRAEGALDDPARPLHRSRQAAEPVRRGLSQRQADRGDGPDRAGTGRPGIRGLAGVGIQIISIVTRALTLTLARFAVEGTPLVQRHDRAPSPAKRERARV